ncbi:MAG: hypothetical protein WC981_03250 [Candidatus Dojkabacteria bacterium]|jgi:hypothetical protein
MTSKLKGVTLVETMLYIGLFAIILIMVLNFMFTTQESTLRTNRKGEIHKVAQFALQHLDDSFDRADGVSLTNTTFGSEQGKLELTFNTESKQYTLTESRLFYDGVAITPSSVTVNSFYLEPVYQQSPEIVGVRVTFSLTSSADSSITEDINMLYVIK